VKAGRESRRGVCRAGRPACRSRKSASGGGVGGRPTRAAAGITKKGGGGGGKKTARSLGRAFLEPGQGEKRRAVAGVVDPSIVKEERDDRQVATPSAWPASRRAGTKKKEKGGERR